MISTQPIIKVCGMREPLNVAQVSTLNIDWMGFIFYEPSKRWVGRQFTLDLDKNIKRVGVFVDASQEEVLQMVNQYKLDMVQLHGSEPVDFCASVRSKGVEVMKAFSIDEHFNFSSTDVYLEAVDYLLFDTKGKLPGGNGVAFDWDLLTQYKGPIPFLLSGGISLTNSAALQSFKHPHFVGVDINSRFEIEPGLKDIVQLKQFTDELRG